VIAVVKGEAVALIARDKMARWLWRIWRVIFCWYVCNKIPIAARALVVLIFIFLRVPVCNKNTGKLGMLTEFV
jgi:hypothetical protein